MSDSELSTPANIPSDAEIEQCLRRVVRDALKNEEEITTNSARTRAEKLLGLETGFLKDNVVWKQKSKDIVTAAVTEPDSPVKTKKSAPKSKPAAKAGIKRKSDESQTKTKRRKKEIPASDDLVDDEEAVDLEEDGEQPALDAEDDDEKHDARGKVVKPEAEPNDEDEDEDEPLNAADHKNGLEAAKSNGKPADGYDSDLSSLIDEPAPKKKRQKKSTSPSDAKKTKSSAKSAKPKPAGKELSADEEEIKRLQSWLLKCGVRKLWHKELANCSTTREKMRHLRKMLEDVGMTGRYSAEKAKQIKEARELAQELEAAQEFNQQWGEASGDEDEDGGEDREGEKKKTARKQPQAAPRRLPRGLIDFGDSGDNDSG